MRGRSTCPTGQEKNPAGATDESLPFSTRKGWVPNRPLIRPSVRTGAPSPRGEGFGGGCFPLGYPPSHRFTRQGTPRRVSPPAGGERKSNHVLTGSAGQNILLTPRVPASPARFGVQPPILGGASHQAGNLTPPYSALPNEAQTPLAPPKILTARRSASPPDPPASAAPPQPGGSGPGSGPGLRWPSGPGGRRGPRCWSFSRSSPGPLGWTGWS